MSSSEQNMIGSHIEGDENSNSSRNPKLKSNLELNIDTGERKKVVAESTSELLESDSQFQIETNAPHDRVNFEIVDSASIRDSFHIRLEQWDHAAKTLTPKGVLPTELRSKSKNIGPHWTRERVLISGKPVQSNSTYVPKKTRSSFTCTVSNDEQDEKVQDIMVEQNDEEKDISIVETLVCDKRDSVPQSDIAAVELCGIKNYDNKVEQNDEEKDIAIVETLVCDKRDSVPQSDIAAVDLCGIKNDDDKVGEIDEEKDIAIVETIVCNKRDSAVGLCGIKNKEDEVEEIEEEKDILETFVCDKGDSVPRSDITAMELYGIINKEDGVEDIDEEKDILNFDISVRGKRDSIPQSDITAVELCEIDNNEEEVLSLSTFDNSDNESTHPSANEAHEKLFDDITNPEKKREVTEETTTQDILTGSDFEGSEHFPCKVESESKDILQDTKKQKSSCSLDKSIFLKELKRKENSTTFKFEKDPSLLSLNDGENSTNVLKGERVKYSIRIDQASDQIIEIEHLDGKQYDLNLKHNTSGKDSSSSSNLKGDKLSLDDMNSTDSSEEGKRTESTDESVDSDDQDGIKKVDMETKSSPLPDASFVRNTGVIYTRTSWKSLLMRQWQRSVWVHYGRASLYIFRTEKDVNSWLSDPELTFKERESLIKVKFDFLQEVKKRQVRGYKLTKNKAKVYEKNGPIYFNFKLEKWLELDKQIAGAFASHSKRELETLRAVIRSCLNNCPYNGLKSIKDLLI